MSVATVTFKIPEEQEEYNCFMAAPRMERAIRDIAEAFRRNRKYDAPAVTETAFYDILKDNDISID